MDAKDEHHIDFLYRALNDAQETIRSTDAKAEIVIVLVGALTPRVLAFVGAIHGRIDTLPLQVLTTVGLVHVLIAAVCAIWALNPRVNPEEFIDVDGVFSKTAAVVLPPYQTRRDRVAHVSSLAHGELYGAVGRGISAPTRRA